MVDFNRPVLIGKELSYIADAIESGHISGNGKYSKKCQEYFRSKFNTGKCLLTSSCTDALEMCAILLDITPGDEVIMPSFTFTSTANAFILRGAKVIFCDSRSDHPGIDESLIEPLINNKTKAIIVVHYAGVACNMKYIMELADRHNLFVVEDAAQAVDSYYEGKALGSIGHLGTFSFHETKNIMCGEGGMLLINDTSFVERAEIIWEKGTNRSSFKRGEVSKYGWVDIGSSFLPSDILAAYLFAQLENVDLIQKKRIALWERYYSNLSPALTNSTIRMPVVPSYATNNAHMFYMVFKDDYRTKFIQFMKEEGVNVVFHYQSLHKSKYYSAQKASVTCENSDRYSDNLVRLPLYYDLALREVDFISDKIIQFLNRY